MSISELLARPCARAAAIRPATPDDHAAIREVVVAAYRPYAAELPSEIFEVYLAGLLDLDAHAQAGDLIVSEVGGEIGGYAAFYPDASVQGLGWPRGWAGGRGLAVDPRHRGCGVATSLMAALEQRAHDAGSPVFAFHTSPFMTGAIALYERRGYRRVPAFDVDLNAHFGIATDPPWTGLAYLRALRPATVA